MTEPARGRARASPAQRLAAKGWLHRLGQPTSPAAVAALAPFVRVDGQPELVEVQAFARLVRLGQVPTAAAVRGQVLSLQASTARRAQLKEQVRSAADDLPAAGRLAAQYVQEHRARTGTGPSWLQLGRHTGWSKAVVQTLMPRLRDAGWLVYDDQPSSLTAGPTFHATPSQSD